MLKNITFAHTFNLMIDYRKIAPEDNTEIKKIIRIALAEFGGNRPGTAYYDREIHNMFEAYNKAGSAYFIAADNNKVIGGGGIQPLKGSADNICELQKVYLDNKYRGKGVGHKILQLCVDFAKSYGYDAIYLETFPNMKGAQKLYKKLGFEFLNHSLGKTGHNTNEIWMLKKLTDN